jgi:protein phosphatase
VLPVAVVFDLPERVCQDRNAERPDRNFGPHVINQQRRILRKSLRRLKKEGFRHLCVFKTPEEVESVRRSRRPAHGRISLATGSASTAS